MDLPLSGLPPRSPLLKSPQHLARTPTMPPRTPTLPGVASTVLDTNIVEEESEIDAEKAKLSKPTSTRSTRGPPPVARRSSLQMQREPSLVISEPADELGEGERQAGPGSSRTSTRNTVSRRQVTLV